MTAIAEMPADAVGSHAWAEALGAASDALSGVSEAPGWSLRDAQVLGLADGATRLVAQAEP